MATARADRLDDAGGAGGAGPRLGALAAVAEAAGLELSYLGWQGTPVVASEASVRAVLAELGITDPDAGDVAAAARLRWGDVIPAVVVAFEDTVDLPMRVDARGNDAFEIIIHTESGRTIVSRGTLHAQHADGHHRFGHETCLRHATAVVDEHGYHRITWQVGEHRGTSQLFRSPPQTYQLPGRARRWGVFAPVYGLRAGAEEREGARVGDLAVMARLLDYVARRGGSYVATLPLLAQFLGEPCQVSPYSSASRLFWNELYLDLPHLAVQAGPEGAAFMEACAATVATVATVATAAGARRPPALIDYKSEYARRRAIIDGLTAIIWQQPGLRGGIEAWALRRGAYDYAAFRAIAEAEKQPWGSWATARRDGTAPIASFEAAVAASGDADAVRSHLVAQWAFEEQLAAIAEMGAGFGDGVEGRGAGLYLDLPVGVGRDAYDVWRERDLFMMATSAGAPPDAVFRGGQDWGLPPIHPIRSSHTAHAYLRRCIAHHMRHARILRLDHVMGLHRLYCVPVGAAATDGVYLTYPAQEMWAILCIESHRNSCAVIGEDLGVVPPAVPVAMQRHGAAGIAVQQFAMPSKLTDVPVPVAAAAVHCMNTHDTATFAAYWHGDDIDLNAQLGLYDEPTVKRERIARSNQRATAMVRAGRNVAEYVFDQSVEYQVMRHQYLEMASGPANDVLVTLEDLWCERDPQNVPGTSDERPNWRRPLRKSMDDIEGDPAIRRLLEQINRAR